MISYDPHGKIFYGLGSMELQRYVRSLMIKHCILYCIKHLHNRIFLLQSAIRPTAKSILSSLKVSMLFINVQLYPYFNLQLSKDLLDKFFYSKCSISKKLCHY